MTTTNNLLHLALAEKACPVDPGGANHPSDCDGGCERTGRVPLLPELREECSVGTEMVCSMCQNRGWTVITNSETIARGLWPLLEQARRKFGNYILHEYSRAMNRGHFAEAWEAAARALEEAGLLAKEDSNDKN